MTRLPAMTRLALASTLFTGIAACDVPPAEETAAIQQDLVKISLFQDVLVDFDSATYQSPLLGPVTIFFGNGDVMDTAYSQLGVNFSCVSCASGHAFARSQGGSLGVSLFPNPTAWPYGGAYDARSGAVEATFDTARSWVSIEATAFQALEGLGTPTARPWLEGYDANGVLVSRMYHSGSINARETLTVSGSIKRVRFSSQYHGTSVPAVYGAFDNLRFNADAWKPIVWPGR